MIFGHGKLAPGNWNASLTPVTTQSNAGSATEILLDNTQRVWRNSVSVDIAKSVDVLGRVVWAGSYTRCLEEKIRLNRAIPRFQANEAIISEVAAKLESLRGSSSRACRDIRGSARQMKYVADPNDTKQKLTSAPHRFHAFRYKELLERWGTAALVFCALTERFVTKANRTTTDILAQIHPIMESHKLSIAAVADCVQPNWRTVLDWAHDDAILAATPSPPSPACLFSWFIDTSGAPRPISVPEQFRYVRESRVDRVVWPDPTYDPRRVLLDTEYHCEFCGAKQLEDPTKGGCQCLTHVINDAATAVQVFETANMGLGIRALQAFESNTIIGEFVGVVGMVRDGVDVLRSSTTSGKYQIGQMEEGEPYELPGYTWPPY